MAMRLPRRGVHPEQSRRAMIRAGREKLSGRVQIDDAFIGGEEAGVRGRQGFKKARIIVAMEIKENGYELGRIRIPRDSFAPCKQSCLSA